MKRCKRKQNDANFYSCRSSFSFFQENEYILDNLPGDFIHVRIPFLFFQENEYILDNLPGDFIV